AGLERVGRRPGVQAYRGCLENPRRGQSLDVLLIDLAQSAVALTVVGAVVGEPVRWLRAGVENALVVAVLGGRRRPLPVAERLVCDSGTRVDVFRHDPLLFSGRGCGGRSCLA